MRIPILQMGDVLLVTVQADIYDDLALALQDDLARQIKQTDARGVLIDVSALDVIDSFTARVLSSIASMSRVLAAEAIVVGMRPAVAITLVELGLPLEGVRTALDVERGMDWLRASLESRREGSSDGRRLG